MKKSIFILAFILLVSQISVPQVKPESMFYIGIGTSLSSYIGSDFGKTFAIRYAPSGYYDDGYYNSYYYRPHSYDDYYGSRETFFPFNSM